MLHLNYYITTWHLPFVIYSTFYFGFSLITRISQPVLAQYPTSLFICATEAALATLREYNPSPSTSYQWSTCSINIRHYSIAIKINATRLNIFSFLIICRIIKELAFCMYTTWLIYHRFLKWNRIRVVENRGWLCRKANK